MQMNGVPRKLARDAWWLAEDPGALPPPPDPRGGQRLATAGLLALLILGGLIVAERLALLRDFLPAAGQGAFPGPDAAAILRIEPQTSRKDP